MGKQERARPGQTPGRTAAAGGAGALRRPAGQHQRSAAQRSASSGDSPPWHRRGPPLAVARQKDMGWENRARDCDGREASVESHGWGARGTEERMLGLGRVLGRRPSRTGSGTSKGTQPVPGPPRLH